MAKNKSFKVGYARVSTTDQDLSIQTAALNKAGVVHIFKEKQSGTSRDGRGQLQEAINMLQEGSTLVVLKLDRLARDMRDLLNIAHEIEAKGANLEILDQNIDTGTAAGKAFLHMLGVFAQFENDLRAERVRAGVARAKAAGKYKGGKKRIIDNATILQHLQDTGEGPAMAARSLGVSRSSVYRAMKSDHP